MRKDTISYNDYILEEPEEKHEFYISFPFYMKNDNTYYKFYNEFEGICIWIDPHNKGQTSPDINLWNIPDGYNDLDPEDFYHRKSSARELMNAYYGYRGYEIIEESEFEKILNLYKDHLNSFHLIDTFKDMSWDEYQSIVTKSKRSDKIEEILSE